MEYSNELKVGAAIVVAAIAALLGVRFLQDIPIFGETYPIYVQFEEAGGLVSGNPVHMKGVSVGSVADVQLDQSTQKVDVRLRIENDIQIPKGSYARVAGFSGLSGVRVSITPGPSENPSLAAGASISGPPEGTVLERLTDQAPMIASKADSLLTNTNRTMLALGQQLQNPESDVRQTLSALEGLTSNLEEVTAAEKENIGALLQNLRAVSSDLKNFTGENGDSLDLAVQRLNQSLNRLNQSLISFEQASSTLNAVTTKLNEGNGTAARLINDPSLYIRLDSAAAHTNTILEDFQENPGRYLNDMTLVRVF